MNGIAPYVAERLTRGQRSVVQNLDRDWSILGCGEVTAKGLAVDRLNRPALVVRRRDGETFEYALNDLGMAVKEAL